MTTTTLQITDDVARLQSIAEQFRAFVADMNERAADALAKLQEASATPSHPSTLPQVGEPAIVGGKTGSVQALLVEFELDNGATVRHCLDDEGLTWRRGKRAEPAVESVPRGPFCSHCGPNCHKDGDCLDCGCACTCEEPSEPAENPHAHTHADRLVVQATGEHPTCGRCGKAKLPGEPCVPASPAKPSEPAGEVTNTTLNEWLRERHAQDADPGFAFTPVASDGLLGVDYVAKFSNAVIARATAADQARIAELEAEVTGHHDRLENIIDEVFGMQPVMSMDELLSVIEREVIKLRQQHDADQARIGELEAALDAKHAKLVEVADKLAAARAELAQVKAERDEAQRSRQSEHEKRVHFQGSFRNAMEKLARRTDMLRDIADHVLLTEKREKEIRDELATDQPAERSDGENGT